MKQRSTYYDVEKGEEIRIVADYGADLYYVGLSEKGNYFPKRIGLEDFRNGLETRRFLTIADPYLIEIPQEISEKDRVVWERNWEWIEKLWEEHREELLDKKTRNRLLNEFAQQEEYSVMTVRRVLRNFFQRGMNKVSVLPNWKNCGAKGKERGMKTNSGSGREDLEEIFRKSYDQFYLTQKKKSYKDAYHQMVDKYFRVDGNLDHEHIPSYSTFWRWASKQNSEERIRKRESDNAFLLNNRILTGSTLDDISYIGDMVEIDATPLDCHAVSVVDRDVLIGRPILYYIVDRYSRLIVGMSVGLDGPSWMGALSALENMVEDKKSYCEEFGIEIDSKDWPVQGQIPQAILGDRGEMISRFSDVLVECYGIDVLNTPPYRGDLKPNVERRFRDINALLKHYVDGAIEKDYRKRGDKDPRDEAKLNLKEVTAICIRKVLHANKKLIEGFDLNAGQIANNVAAVPIELWNYAKEHSLDSWREVDIEQFRRSLLPRETRTVNRYGIRLNSLTYVALDAKTKAWLQEHQRERVEVLYDPQDLSQIFIHYKGDWISLALAEKNKSFQEMTYQEYELFQNQKKWIQEQAQEKQLENEIEIRKQVEAINQSVDKKTTKKSRLQQKKHIRSNRQQEKERLKSKTVFTVEKEESSEPLIDVHDVIDDLIKEI